jgi:hypothetical protein
MGYTPMRCTPMRYTPMRYTPMRHMPSKVHAYEVLTIIYTPMRVHTQ